MKFILGLSLWLLLPFLGMAQHTQTVRNNHQWIHSYAEFRVSERFNVLADAGFRVSNLFRDPNLYIVRVGGTFNVHPKWKVGLGFAHSGLFADSDLYQLEYRPHQEVISEHVFSDVEITNRLRIEERVQRVLFNDSLVPFVARVRFKFHVAAPIVSLSKNHPERKLFLILADEFLLNAVKDIKYNILDQNRMIVGLSFRISNHLDVALLYSYQFGTTTKPNVFTQDHVVWLSVNHKFDFRKDKEKNLSSRTLD
jgi:hypothetical protein